MGRFCGKKVLAVGVLDVRKRFYKGKFLTVWGKVLALWGKVLAVGGTF